MASMLYHEGNREFQDSLTAADLPIASRSGWRAPSSAMMTEVLLKAASISFSRPPMHRAARIVHSREGRRVS